MTIFFKEISGYKERLEKRINTLPTMVFLKDTVCVIEIEIKYFKLPLYHTMTFCMALESSVSK